MIDSRLETLNIIAVSRGGKLLTTEWYGSDYKYEFQDAKGKKFNLTPRSLRNGRWTPDRGLVSEPICRQYLEHLFGYSFPKTTKILITKVTNRERPLELDGYSEEIKLAFEYQGHQSHWNKNHKDYLRVSEIDNLKIELCRKLNIVLIQIPKFPEIKGKWTTDNLYNHIYPLISQGYKSLRLEIPKINQKDFCIDFSIINHGEKMLNELREIAQANKGKLISTVWTHSDDPYIFAFEDGRQFTTRLSDLRKRKWPTNPDKYLERVNHKYKTDYEKLKKFRELAMENGGQLLSKKYTSVDDKYFFTFKDGREFSIFGNNLIKNGWPQDPDDFLKRSYNASKTGTQQLEELRVIAESNGGKLISTEWVNLTTKYLFEFADGRQFLRDTYQTKNKPWPSNPDKYLNLSKVNNKIKR